MNGKQSRYGFRWILLGCEDAQSIAEKGAWAKTNSYGSCIIWTSNLETTWPYGVDGYKNPLLDAVKQAFLQ